MTIRQHLAALLLAAGCSGAALAAPVAVVAADGTYLGFDAISVQGTLYNVRFVEGTFNAVFGGTPQFALESQASAAAFGLLQALEGEAALDADPSRMFGCGATDTVVCNVMTSDAELSSLPTDVDVIAVRNGREADFVLNGLNAFSVDTGFDTSLDNIGPGGVHSYVWAQWSTGPGSTVPEPSGLALVITAATAAGVIGRRRPPKR